MNLRAALRQEQVAVVGGGRRVAAEDRRGAQLLPQAALLKNKTERVVKILWFGNPSQGDYTVSLRINSSGRIFVSRDPNDFKSAYVNWSDCER
jgi:hypothetical protein